MVRSDASAIIATRTPQRAHAEYALAHVLALLERLPELVTAPPADDARGEPSELEAVVCGISTQLRATGATPAEVNARLTALVRCAAGEHRPAHETARRIAAVAAWCERGEVATARWHLA